MAGCSTWRGEDLVWDGALLAEIGTRDAGVIGSGPVDVTQGTVPEERGEAVGAPRALLLPEEL